MLRFLRGKNLFLGELQTISYRFQLQQLVAFLLVRLVIVAFHRDEVACATVGEGVGNEGPTHEVVHHTPHSAHLNRVASRKILDIGHHRRHKLRFGGHVGAFQRAGNVLLQHHVAHGHEAVGAKL